MKDNLVWFLGADLFSTLTYVLLQTNIPDFVVDNTVKMVAAMFVGLVGGFMGVIGKRMAEDYLKNRKQKRDANKKTRS